MGFRDLKCRNGAQNRNLREKLSKTGPVEKFWLWSKSTVNGQRMTCADVAGREAQQARVVREWAWTGTWGAWQVPTARGGAWSTCSWGRNFSRRVEARVMQFLAVLGWVLLSIGCFVFLCLFFGSWMHRTLISECCRYFGRDGSGSLLTVTTGWRRG